MEIALRRAVADDAPTLTAISMRAKASWGYDDAFMAACAQELTLSPEKLDLWEVWVADADGEVAGMIAIEVAPPPEIEEFFVEPAFQGQGVGARLMAQAIKAARAAGATALGVEADPFAEPIYHRLSFRTVGRSPSGSIPGRWLPRLEMDLRSAG